MSSAEAAPEHTREYHQSLLEFWHTGDVGFFPHRYRRCGFSGAGNCCCGRDDRSPLHAAVGDSVRAYNPRLQRVLLGRIVRLGPPLLLLPANRREGEEVPLSERGWQLTVTSPAVTEPGSVPELSTVGSGCSSKEGESA